MMFVVRLWQELSNLPGVGLQNPSPHDLPDHWRGMIEHVPSKERLYFTTAADLYDFLILKLHSRPDENNDEESKE